MCPFFIISCLPSYFLNLWDAKLKFTFYSSLNLSNAEPYICTTRTLLHDSVESIFPCKIGLRSVASRRLAVRYLFYFKIAIHSSCVYFKILTIGRSSLSPPSRDPNTPDIFINHSSVQNSFIIPWLLMERFSLPLDLRFILDELQYPRGLKALFLSTFNLTQLKL